MMAVGTSFVEARALCEDAKFAGRLVVAASNAPSSVTISGDKDAINELKVQLDQKVPLPVFSKWIRLTVHTICCHALLSISIR
ncbi:hypothetical protein BDV30DRAFT_205282 [Aspergillus minisclerotigenes]|uniref:Uncharacterized protein n=1 Tax=Aspergillus minisclerotigenes TaxID=656917 RepID=A0A5N6JE92_9EURO|nr:hypothetical protein BDV30DRAFT_205282 [Aspergillus minisclerotigenes]